MKKEINIWSYLEEYEIHRNEILQLVNNVFNSGRLIFGSYLSEFENNFSDWIGAKYGIGVGNGTDAIKIALMSAGIQQGDEVITVSNTAVPTVSAIVDAQAIPVFCDIEEKTFNIDPEKISELISKRTKAILAVHLYGHPANVSALKKICRENNLILIEDCAQSHGSRFNNVKTGNFGKISAFSFYPTKILGGYGDGGMVITNNQKLFSKSKMIRFYGMENQYYSKINGVNSRLDDIHAAILNYKLKYIDDDIRRRREIANYYSTEIKNESLILPTEKEGYFHSYYLYVVRSKNRKEIISKLSKNKINVNISYPWPIHTMPPFKKFRTSSLEVTNRLSQEIFSLPMYPNLSDVDVERVVKIINK